MQPNTPTEQDNKTDPQRLQHFNVNTGEKRLLLRSEVSDEELDRLRPLSVIGGPIAGTPDLMLSLMRVQGAVLFTLWQGCIPMETCGVAWTAAGAEAIWPRMVELHHHLFGETLPADRKPAKLPWLGAMIWPSILELETWEAGPLLDKLQKELAWVYLEAGDSPIQSPPWRQAAHRLGAVHPGRAEKRSRLQRGGTGIDGQRQHRDSPARQPPRGCAGGEQRRETPKFALEQTCDRNAPAVFPAGRPPQLQTNARRRGALPYQPVAVNRKTHSSHESTPQNKSRPPVAQALLETEKPQSRTTSNIKPRKNRIMQPNTSNIKPRKDRIMKSSIAKDRDRSAALRGLQHYTLNTGHTRLSPRNEVCEEAIKALLPLVQRGGPIPKTPGFRLMLTRREGGALFTFSKSGLPVVTCGVAWTKDAEKKFWTSLSELYETVFRGSMQPARKPAPLPWLAVMLLPGILFLTHEDVSMLGDLERCIAWTLFEDEARQANNPGESSQT